MLPQDLSLILCARSNHSRDESSLFSEGDCCLLLSCFTVAQIGSWVGNDVGDCRKMEIGHMLKANEWYPVELDSLRALTQRSTHFTGGQVTGCSFSGCLTWEPGIWFAEVLSTHNCYWIQWQLLFEYLQCYVMLLCYIGFSHFKLETQH